VDFEEAWKDKVNGELDDLPVFFLGWDALLMNKQAAGREKDLADVGKLTAVKRKTKKH
jgi:hypothetical protein